MVARKGNNASLFSVSASVDELLLQSLLNPGEFVLIILLILVL
jgi:hypothetical protein